MRSTWILSIIGAACLLGVSLYQRPNAAVSLFSSSSSSTDKEIEEAFIHFIAKYGKTYTSKQDVNTRYETFAKNYKMVKEHNALPNVAFTMVIN